jgi:hypothetical protein
LVVLAGLLLLTLLLVLLAASVSHRASPFRLSSVPASITQREYRINERALLSILETPSSLLTGRSRPFRHPDRRPGPRMVVPQPRGDSPPGSGGRCAATPPQRPAGLATTVRRA